MLKTSKTEGNYMREKFKRVCRDAMTLGSGKISWPTSLACSNEIQVWK